MSETDIQRLMHRGENCPSELDLDRLHLGEISDPLAGPMRNHIAQCAHCAKRMALRQAGFEAFVELEENALRARIRIELEREETKRKKSILPWPAWAFAAVAAVVLLAIPLVVNHHSGSREPDAIRAKGALGLRIFRNNLAVVAEVSSGETFAPGDHLRFRVDVPRAGHLMVIGLEQSGKTYACYPTDAPVASRPVQAGLDQDLPGAVRLDDTLGQEWLFLVLCDRPFDLASLETTSDASGLATPAGCLTTAFKMMKAAP